MSIFQSFMQMTECKIETSKRVNSRRLRMLKSEEVFRKYLSIRKDCIPNKKKAGLLDEPMTGSLTLPEFEGCHYVSEEVDISEVSSLAIYNISEPA
mmetsp:Transcript_34289/g.60009  ORF Transcript_34289/g.60009 Transcript_34289/m.60009 type:complete len:96 (+) Transcript_34289:3298-3585(+)